MKKLLALLLVLTVVLGCASAMAWNYDGLPPAQLCMPVSTDKIPIQVSPVTVPEINWYIEDGWMYIESDWFYDDYMYSFIDADLYNPETEETVRARFIMEEPGKLYSRGENELDGFVPAYLTCYTRVDETQYLTAIINQYNEPEKSWTNLSTRLEMTKDGVYTDYSYDWNETGYLDCWTDNSRRGQTNDVLQVWFNESGSMTEYEYTYPTADEMLWNTVTFLADGTMTDACFLIGDQRYSYSYSTTSGKEYWHKGYSWGPQIEAPEGYSRGVLCDRFPALTHGAFDVVGDADGDGMVTVNDVMDILRFSAGDDMEISFYGSDVTNDGLINEWDALLILQKMAGWDVQLK